MAKLKNVVAAGLTLAVMAGGFTAAIKQNEIKQWGASLLPKVEVPVEVQVPVEVPVEVEVPTPYEQLKALFVNGDTVTAVNIVNGKAVFPTITNEKFIGWLNTATNEFVTPDSFFSETTVIRAVFEEEQESAIEPKLFVVYGSTVVDTYQGELYTLPTDPYFVLSQEELQEWELQGYEFSHFTWLVNGAKLEDNATQLLLTEDTVLICAPAAKRQSFVVTIVEVVNNNGEIQQSAFETMTVVKNTTLSDYFTQYISNINSEFTFNGLFTDQNLTQIYDANAPVQMNLNIYISLTLNKDEPQSNSYAVLVHYIDSATGAEVLTQSFDFMDLGGYFMIVRDALRVENYSGDYTSSGFRFDPELSQSIPSSWFDSPKYENMEIWVRCLRKTYTTPYNVELVSNGGPYTINFSIRDRENNVMNEFSQEVSANASVTLQFDRSVIVFYTITPGEGYAATNAEFINFNTENAKYGTYAEEYESGNWGLFDGYQYIQFFDFTLIVTLQQI